MHWDMAREMVMNIMLYFCSASTGAMTPTLVWNNNSIAKNKCIAKFYAQPKLHIRDRSSCIAWCRKNEKHEKQNLFGFLQLTVPCCGSPLHSVHCINVSLEFPAYYRIFPFFLGLTLAGDRFANEVGALEPKNRKYHNICWMVSSSRNKFSVCLPLAQASCYLSHICTTYPSPG